MKNPETNLISESGASQLLTINPFVIGTRMLKTKIRAFNFVVHLISEEGVHKTLPTLKIRKEMTLTLLHNINYELHARTETLSIALFET